MDSFPLQNRFRLLHVGVINCPDQHVDCHDERHLPANPSAFHIASSCQSGARRQFLPPAILHRPNQTSSGSLGWLNSSRQCTEPPPRRRHLTCSPVGFHIFTNCREKMVIWLDISLVLSYSASLLVYFNGKLL